MLVKRLVFPYVFKKNMSPTCPNLKSSWLCWTGKSMIFANGGFRHLKRDVSEPEKNWEPVHLHRRISHHLWRPQRIVPSEMVTNSDRDRSMQQSRGQWSSNYIHHHCQIVFQDMTFTFCYNYMNSWLYELLWAFIKNQLSPTIDYPLIHHQPLQGKYHNKNLRKNLL